MLLLLLLLLPLRMLAMTVMLDAGGREMEAARFVRYFSDFAVDWRASQMIQNVVYGVEWVTGRLRPALTYSPSTYTLVLTAANACTQ